MRHESKNSLEKSILNAYSELIKFLTKWRAFVTSVTCAAEMGVNYSEALGKSLIDDHEDTLADVRQFASLSALLNVDAAESWCLTATMTPSKTKQ